MDTVALDKEIHRQHIQSLSNADQIQAFFALLGYNTDVRVEQTPASLGISPDVVVRKISRIELIAEQEGMFYVYLFELDSVTVAATRAIARAFRNRAGNYLLVLTSDYERVDFVLVEKLLPVGVAPTAIGQKQVGVRPRSLTVERRNPERIQIRVLRRFTYTEPDPIAQYEKLLSAYSVADWSEEHFNNRALFADYFLKERLPSLPEWKEDPKPAYSRFRQLYAQAASRWANKKEGELRNGLLIPTFETLGFKYKVGKPPNETSTEPDFLLFSPDNGQEPVALCLAYPWGRTLDGKDHSQRDAETPDENPGQIVVSLLEKGQADWVIVTNGKHWRLYHAKAHSKATNYYEIDLEETLAQVEDAADSFRYFWLLFRRRAFEPIPEELIPEPDKARPENFLERLLRESHDYAKRLGDRLKDRAFEEIFPHFAEGFIEHIRQRDGLDADLSQPDLDRIFQGTLTFLYRLLFLLYAEARDLLPVKETRGYYEKSLKKLKEEVADAAKTISDEAPDALKRKYRNDSTALYERLAELFATVDRGDPNVNVPPYNGGLFLTDVGDDGQQSAGTQFITSPGAINRAPTTKIPNGETRFVETPNDQPPAETPNDQSRPGTPNDHPPVGTPNDQPPVGAQFIAPEIANARFLQENKIPDLFLARGLDLLARDEDEKTHSLVFIDYKSLGVRQLGSIYEGLLEFKLRIAPEKMAVCKGKRTEEVAPYKEAKQKNLKVLTEGRGAQAKERVFKKGAVYLENDRRERKATGSYYTPDFIVEYIVENTVGPVLEEKFKEVEPRLREAEQAYRNAIKRREAFVKKGMKGDDPEKVATTYEHVVRELFDVKALDPAMGSGHFLVEAVDFITDKMLNFLNGFPWNPVISQTKTMRDTILGEMEDHGITIDKGRLTDVNLLKRHVLKRCIYGVDLNPMAVELAKVSLWLDCFTLGAPLSFLDHHLKCGNSLIGADVEEVRQELEGGQGLLWGSQFAGLMMATDLMRSVGELSDITSTQVQQSRTQYRKACDALAPFKRILDVHASQWFGNTPYKVGQGRKAEFRTPSTEFLKSPESEVWLKNPEDTRALGDPGTRVVNIALAAAEKNRFFHWQLEFPEVFYGVRQGTERVVERKDNAGFDAVIGNPPYVRQETLGDLKPYLEAAFSEVYSGIADIYVYFYARGLGILRKGGRFGMITSNKFMRANYGKSLCSFLGEKHGVCEIIDFGDLPVFEDPTAYPCIVLCTAKIAPENGPRFTKVAALPVEDLRNLVMENGKEISHSAISGSTWSLSETNEQVILEKMRAISIPLGEYCDNSIRRGVLTGFNEAFVIDRVTRDRLISEDPKSAEIIKPLVVGQDIDRYEVNFQDRYLIFTRRGIAIREYPAIKRYLEQWKAQLTPKTSSSEKGLGRKPGNYQWYEIQDTIDYYADFEKPKIIYPNICKTPEFYFDHRDGYFTNQKCFIIPNIDLYLVAFLNSQLDLFLFRTILPKLRGDFFEPSLVFFKDFPVRRIHFTTPESEREKLVGQLSALYQKGADGYPEILNLVETLLPMDADGKLLAFKQGATGAEEKSDVVHDFLSFLAEQMLELNKRKQAEIKRFIAWLEKELRITAGKSSVGAHGRAPLQGINALTGKTAIRDYLGDYQKGEEPLPFKKLIDTLHKNKSRIGVSLSDPHFVARLEKEYGTSLETLLPIKDRLAATDRLIDQIVYRLYGLTEEEIEIVERKR